MQKYARYGPGFPFSDLFIFRKTPQNVRIVFVWKIPLNHAPFAEMRLLSMPDNRV